MKLTNSPVRTASISGWIFSFLILSELSALRGLSCSRGSLILNGRGSECSWSTSSSL